ncbi:MAG: ferritin-like domain-containing protein [Proteobacteria bacterium]|nr:ferritin-like domain-containing protein [Pseudomonadota bacterium]MBK8957071.1 ferritin-like domain-containing protein [Pseudomonadota bacterium]
MLRPWKLDDIAWSDFQPALVDPSLLAAVKTASVVEANSADYVRYLHNVFGDDAAFKDAASRWGEEEAQHGAALGRWAQMADPQFDFAASLAHFRAGYRIPVDSAQSIRGSRAGELLARCVVESGTCSYYSALRDRAREPVLRQICHRIAQDEAQHYRLFHQHLSRYAQDGGFSRWARLRVALGRVGETDDDELAFAYHSAVEARASGAVYDRARCGAEYQRLAMSMYALPHVRTLVGMIALALGWRGTTRMVRAAGWLGWWWLRLRWSAGLAGR